MDNVITHFNDNWKFYTVLVTLAAFAGLWWLSKYFATKKELELYVQQNDKRFSDHEQKLQAHQTEQNELRGLVHELDSHVKNLPDAKEISALREEIARLNGRLEGIEPIFKQGLNHINMLIENELRGEKK